MHPPAEVIIAKIPSRPTAAAGNRSPAQAPFAVRFLLAVEAEPGGYANANLAPKQEGGLLVPDVGARIAKAALLRSGGP